MATSTERVQVIIDVDTDGTKDFETAASRLDRFRTGVDKLVAPAAVVAGALVAGAKVAADYASAQEQAMGAVDAVFGKNAATVRAWADEAAQAAGLTRAEYGEFASVLGAQLGNLGLSADDALASTGNLISLGADLAAQFGGSSADAVAALSAALRGEADPAERYGLALNQTAVNARLAEKGQDKLTGSALAAAKAQAVVELATEQAGSAVGAFAREQDTAAGSSAIATAQLKNAAATIGSALLPAVASAAGALAGMAGWVENNSTLVLVLAGVAGTLAIAVLATAAALRVWTTVQVLWTTATQIAAAAQWAWNAALAANPIGLIILAIIAAVAAVVLLWKKNEGFRNFVLKAWEAIKSGAVAAWNGIKTAALAVVDTVRSKWESVTSWLKNAWTQTKNTATSVWNAIKSAAGSVADAVKSAWTQVVSSLRSAFDTLRAAATKVTDAIKTGFTIATTPIRVIIEAVRSLISLLGRVKMPKISFPSLPSWLGGRSAAAAPSTLAAPMSRAALPAAMTAAGPALLAPSAAPTLSLERLLARTAAAQASGPVIVVNGALDPEAVARQLRRILDAHERRTGRKR